LKLRSVIRRGLTLAELAIVILVLGMLFSVLFGALFGISRIINMSSPQAEARRQALLTLETLRNTINQTYFNPDLDRIVFHGKNSGSGERRQDRLTFAAVHPGADSLGVPAVREVSFYLRREKDDFTLIRREDQHVDKEPGKGGMHYTLLGSVTSFKLRYSLSGKEWTDTWKSSEIRRIPRLVQIQFTVRIGEKEQLFETLAYTGLYLQ